MRVCLIAEGCYPYVTGGVSGWIDSLVKSFPDIEFVVVAIVANRSVRGKFVYQLPDNITEVHEVYLEDTEWSLSEDFGRGIDLKPKQNDALKGLISGKNVDWNELFIAFNKSFSLDKFLMGPDFYRAAAECYDSEYNQLTFADFIWTIRSMYLPLFFVMKCKMPQADIYHCVATGYSGILGAMGKFFWGGKLVISEHGIYTREREEEIIKASWVQNVYKDLWMDQFRKMSKCAYGAADIVTSLYAHARELQIEFGCPPDKTRITPNGINTDRFKHAKGKQPEDEDYCNIGAVLRVTPIKDVKTMIQAFAFAKEINSRLRLWIMGPEGEDKKYARECHELVEALHVDDVIFTGSINPVDYLGRMDATILTSISEGQPLTILESYACKVPVIATDVGNCKGLIYGEDDDFGRAGILTHIMNVKEISEAMLFMATNADERTKMGQAGYDRLMRKYKVSDMQNNYEDIYRTLADEGGVPYPERETDYGKNR